jgi:hypothetical protein
MVLNVYYNEKTGEIVGYQGGDYLTPLNEVPKGCLRAAYMNANIFNASHMICMKVDVETKKLVPINDPVPIDEKQYLPDLEKKLGRLKEDLATAMNDPAMEQYRDFLTEQVATAQLLVDQMKAAQGRVEIT